MEGDEEMDEDDLEAWGNVRSLGQRAAVAASTPTCGESFSLLRHFREEVTSCRENLLAREDECRDYGRRVRGARYNPPTVGADNISRKLAQIANTANKVGASFFLQLGTFLFSSLQLRLLI